MLNLTGSISKSDFGIVSEVYLGPGYKNDRTRGGDSIKKKMKNKD